jgi:hypothetical protein
MKDEIENFKIYKLPIKEREKILSEHSDKIVYRDGNKNAIPDFIITQSA